MSLCKVHRSDGLDVVRCLMNYMIVLLHAWAAFQYVDCTTYEFYGWTFICSYFCAMALPTFFLISGYLMFQKFSINIWPSKMLRRIKRLLVPYIVWNITFVLIYLGVAKMVPRISERVVTFGLDSVYGCISKIISLHVAPIDGPLWFLRALLILSLLSPIMWMFSKWRNGMMLLLVCFIWVGAELLFGLSRPLCNVIPSYGIFCFALGGVVSEKGKNILEYFNGKKWIALGFIACVIRAALLIPYGMAHEVPPIMISFVSQYLYLLEAPAMISLVAQMNTDAIVRTKPFVFLKDLSFFAYAGHFLICSMYLHLVAPRLGFMHAFKFTMLILVFVGFGVPTMGVVYWLGKRSFPKLLKLWDGSL